jgi:predicted restriction endonuclease
MNKRAKACDFTPKIKAEIKVRDKGCLFCRMHYRMSTHLYDHTGSECMHVINRSQGGLGVLENGIEGCIYHHRMLDNGLHSEEMRNIAEDYIKSLYPGWTRESVTYNKYKDLIVYKTQH